MWDSAALTSVVTPLLSDGSFGHPGAGGSLAFADLDRDIGSADVMNQMHAGLAADPRPCALVDAVRHCT